MLERLNEKHGVVRWMESNGFKKVESPRGGFAWIKDYDRNTFLGVHEDRSIWLSYNPKIENQVNDIDTLMEYGLIDFESKIFNKRV